MLIYIQNLFLYIDEQTHIVANSLLQHTEVCKQHLWILLHHAKKYNILPISHHCYYLYESNTGRMIPPVTTSTRACVCHNNNNNNNNNFSWCTPKDVRYIPESSSVDSKTCWAVVTTVCIIVKKNSWSDYNCCKLKHGKC